MEALGRLVDFAIGSTAVNISSTTGKRVSLRNATGATCLISLAAAGTGTESVVATFQQHTAATGGTSANLTVIDHCYVKTATALAGTEQWLRVGQTASQTLTLADTLTTTGSATSVTAFAQKQALIAVEIHAPQLSDIYAYVSVNFGALTNARVGSVTWVLHDMQVRRFPTSLAPTLA